MKLIARHLAPYLVAATSLTPIAAHAGSFYVFGDSLADNGNITRTYGVPSFAYIEGANAQYYYDSHFSNGPTWAEDLPGLTGLSFATGNDYAVGGAFTGPLTIGNTVYNNISNYEGLPFPLPNFLQEISSFAAAGGHFGAGDVAGVWIGANNYFIAAGAAEQDPANGQAIITNAVTQDITQTSQGVSELIGLGARTLIVQNLPPLGATPDFNSSGPLAIGTANAISTAHDENLSTAMDSLHASTGANIIVVNEAQLYNELLANPAAYGKTNITDACVNDTTCRSAPLAVQNQYLFWDDVHPTAGTHAIIAAYTAADLNGFRGLTAAAQMASDGAAAFSNILSARMGNLQSGASGFAVNLPQQHMVAALGATDATAEPAPVGKLSGFITGNYDYGSRKSAPTAAGFSYSAGTFALGVDDRIAPGIALGAAFGYGTDSATADYGAKLSASAYQFGGYATFYQPDFYLNLKGTFGFDNYNNTRPGVLAAGIRGKPSGYSYDFGGEMGYLMHCDYAAFGPIAGIDTANTHIAAYTESGDPALTQSVDSEDYQRVIANAGLAATMNVSVANLILHPRISATLNDLLSGNGGNFDSVFTDEPTVTLTSTYPKPTHLWAELSGGVSANITPRITLSADFTTTIAKSDGEDHQVSASLHYLF
jgi:outer membrane lipase/esterase